MPLAENNQVVEAQMRYTSLGEQVENVLWFHNISGVPLSAAHLLTLGQTLFDWYDAGIRTNQAQSTILREIYLRQAIDSGALEHTFTPLLPTAGGANEAQAPNNVTLCVSFRTGFSGRANRGRSYFIGIVKSQVAGNQIVGAYANDILTSYASLPTFLAAQADFEHVVYSQSVGGGPRDGGGLATPVTGYVLTDTNIDSQRRRLAGRGS